MLGMILSAVLLGAASPAMSQSIDDDAKARNAQNWEVMFSQYPPGALAAREQGVVGFEVALDRDGFATECRVIQSSGYARLDAETCELVMDRGRFKGVAGADGRRKAVVTRGVVNWVLPNLPAGSVLRVADASAISGIRVAEASADSTDKRICKRERTTGTLAGFERICMSAREWELQRARNRQEWGELQGSKGSTSGN